MLTTRRFQMFSWLAMVMATLVLPMQTSWGQDSGGSRLRLQGRMSGVKAVAKYEERGTQRKFNFQLELATPGQVGTVSAVASNGASVTMGTFTVDALRRGIIDIDTSEGDNVADLNSGATVTLNINGNTYTGTLSPR